MYAIKKTEFYYGPKQINSYVIDGLSCSKALFKTKAEALTIVEILDNSVYYLKNNEYSRPDYKVVRVNKTD